VAKNPHPQGEVDWASASVRDGELTVALVGDPDTAWARSLQAIVERLDRPGSGWGEIKVTKAKLSVASLSTGSEADLRHFLDSAVLQVNTKFAADDDPDQGEDGQSDEDRRMTEVFRSFSAEPSEGGGQD
jgi:hypothetical protein